MKLRQVLASVIAGLTLLAVVTMSGAQATMASWGDSDYSKGGFTGKTILPPLISSCVLSPGLLGATPTITVIWHFPVGSGYATPGNIQYFLASGGLLPGLTQVVLGSNLTTSAPSAGNYTTVFGSALLGGLLGGSYLVGLRDAENGWTSTLTSYIASMGALGAGPTCTSAGQNP